ncbi:MAG: hypothetical protein M0D55_05100 [Elusimicrobiota bacterium]|nr:MAG: hypothetical protein M0D55_05100 [Elusimicrobiota bacterium]
MSSAQVAADYIRSHRASESDGTIRAALDGQGFTPELLDEAFRLAGPRADTPAPARAPFRRRFCAAGCGWRAAGSRSCSWPSCFCPSCSGMTSRGRRPAWPPSRRAWSLSSPDLADADAAEDYAFILASASQKAWAGPPQPLSPQQLAHLDRALTKARSSLALRLSTPGLDSALVSTALRMKLLYAASRALGDRSKEAEARGDWAAAEDALRREVLLGWHAAQDCDVALQNVGMGVVVDALGRQGRAAAQARGSDGLAEREKAVAELEAYLAAPDVVRAIRAEAADPAKLSGLLARLSDAPSRRAYAHWTLMMAAVSWSPGEIALARPSPSARASSPRPPGSTIRC